MKRTEGGRVQRNIKNPPHTKQREIKYIGARKQETKHKII